MMSEQIGNLAKALAAAQVELENPALNKINPHFRSKYADLASVLNAVRPVLGKHGIALMQITETLDTAVLLRSRLVHSSGEWIEATYPVANIGKHQEMGAALTYAKRQSLSALVGVAGEEDDDGNEATEKDMLKGAAAAPKAAAAKTTKKDNPDRYDESKSASVFDEMVMALEECASKPDMVAWANKYAPMKANLTDEHKKLIEKAFQDAQIRIRDAAQAPKAEPPKSDDDDF